MSRQRQPRSLPLVVTQNPAVRVATYTRISTDEENQPYSPGAQDDRLSSYIRSQEAWEPALSFSDQMTGSVLERPGLQRLLSDAHAGRFDLLLVYRVDRLSRSVRGLAQILEELERARVLFRSATEPFDTGSAAGRMMVQMLGVFAEFERATLIDRVVAGLERKAARGEWHGGKTPFGYAAGLMGLVIVETEAVVVRLVFDLYVYHHLGTRAIAMWLNERGHRTRTGRPWSHKLILDMLRNPIYVGDVAFRGCVHPGVHPPIIERSLFDACAALLTERGEDYSQRASNSSEYVLAGVVRCSKCQKRMLGTDAHGRRYRYRYYTCQSRQIYGRHGCDAARVGADRFELEALKHLLTTFRNGPLVRAALARAAELSAAGRPRIDAQRATVEAHIVRLEGVIRRYHLAFEAGTMAAEDCGPRLTELGSQLRELRALDADLEVQQAAECVPEASDLVLAQVCARIERIMDSGTPAEKKALVKELVHTIVVKDNRAYPQYRVPRSGVRIVGPLVDPRGFEPLTF